MERLMVTDIRVSPGGSYRVASSVTDRERLVLQVEAVWSDDALVGLEVWVQRRYDSVAIRIAVSVYAEIVPGVSDCIFRFDETCDADVEWKTFTFSEDHLAFPASADSVCVEAGWRNGSLDRVWLDKPEREQDND